MDVKEAIGTRRAFRSLEPVEIKKELVNDLAECAQITASCFNNQPWRYVFVYEKGMLDKLNKYFEDSWSKGTQMQHDEEK